MILVYVLDIFNLQFLERFVDCKSVFEYMLIHCVVSILEIIPTTLADLHACVSMKKKFFIELNTSLYGLSNMSS